MDMRFVKKLKYVSKQIILLLKNVFLTKIITNDCASLYTYTHIYVCIHIYIHGEVLTYHPSRVTSCKKKHRY